MVAARARQLARKSAKDEDEEDEERHAPKKRRRKPKKSAGLSPVLLMLLIGGAVLHPQEPVLGTALMIASVVPLLRALVPVRRGR